MFGKIKSVAWISVFSQISKQLTALNAIGATISFNIAASQFGEVGKIETLSCATRVAMQSVAGGAIQAGWVFVGLATVSSLLAFAPKITELVSDNKVGKIVLNVLSFFQAIIVIFVVLFSYSAINATTKTIMYFLDLEVSGKALKKAQAECSRL